MGECEREVMPDKAFVIFQVSKLESTASRSKSMAAQIYQNILNELKKITPKLELATKNYTTVPEYQWKKSQKVFKGHRTLITLKVTTSEIKEIASIIDIALKQKFTSSVGPSSFITTELYKKNYNECLVLAAIDAKGKAQQLVKSLGVKLGGPIEITEQFSSNNNFEPLPRGQMMMKAADNSTPELKYENQKISLKVNVIFSLI
jgi:uncharacterized protein YggE